MGKQENSSGEGQKIAATNRKARFEYLILETLQAGIVLQGTEVKSVREGKVNLGDSYAQVKNGEMYLCDCHISPYSHGTYANHNPLRSRKLLLHKREIVRLFTKTQMKGLTLVPLKMYFVQGKVKVDIAVARGKKLHDKRDSIKERDLDREMRRSDKYD